MNNVGYVRFRLVRLHFIKFNNFVKFVCDCFVLFSI